MQSCWSYLLVLIVFYWIPWYFLYLVMSSENSQWCQWKWWSKELQVFPSRKAMKNEAKIIRINIFRTMETSQKLAATWGALIQEKTTENWQEFWGVLAYLRCIHQSPNHISLWICGAPGAPGLLHLGRILCAWELGLGLQAKDVVNSPCSYWGV